MTHILSYELHSYLFNTKYKTVIIFIKFISTVNPELLILSNSSHLVKGNIAVSHASIVTE